jgi:hypothetical protein
MLKPIPANTANKERIRIIQPIITTRSLFFLKAFPFSFEALELKNE